MTLFIRDRTPTDDAWVVGALSELWGSPFAVSRGRGHRADHLPAIVVDRDAVPVGLLTYRIAEAELKVVC